MKKIAIVGTHGVGKTILTRALSNFAQRTEQKIEVIAEVVRDCPFPIHEGQTLETTTWIVCKQMVDELGAEAKKPDLIICDRSAYDPLPYLLYTRPEQFSQELMEFVEAYGRSYTKIFLIRPSGNNIENDGFRSTDLEFQLGINSIFTSWLLGKATIIEQKEIFDGNINKLCRNMLEISK